MCLKFNSYIFLPLGTGSFASEYNFFFLLSVFFTKVSYLNLPPYVANMDNARNS